MAHAQEDLIEGHLEALRTLVRNLLENAVKYSPVGGTGSGLGLAIIKAITELHGAGLHLGHSERFGGRKVSVSFHRPE